MHFSLSEKHGLWWCGVFAIVSALLSEGATEAQEKVRLERVQQGDIRRVVELLITDAGRREVRELQDKVALSTSELSYARGQAATVGSLAWSLHGKSGYQSTDRSMVIQNLRSILDTAIGQHLLEEADYQSFKPAIDSADIQIIVETPPSPSPQQKPQLLPGLVLEGGRQAAGPIQKCRPWTVVECSPWNMVPIPQQCIPKYSHEIVSDPPDVHEEPVALATRILAVIERQSASPSQNAFVSVSTDSTNTRRPRDRELGSLFFGEAYHAFWQGDYAAALRLLETALQADDQDARVWYYKGLAELRIGQNEASYQSLAVAIRLHRANTVESSSVNKSLERVQGSLRMELEAARVRAVTVQPTRSVAVAARSQP